MSTNKLRVAVEWVGGITSMPGYVVGEGAPYRPEMLFWIGEDGAVLGSRIGKPGELLSVAAESLRYATECPRSGRPHLPTHIRVSSKPLAEVIRAAHPSIDVICAPTPELKEVFENLREYLDEDSDGPTYLSYEVRVNDMEALFEAAAELYRNEPWSLVPDDHCLLSVSIDSLGIRNALVSVIGQRGESRGLVFFSSLEDFHAFSEAAQAADHGGPTRTPTHMSLTFERGGDLPPSLRKEIALFEWEIAATNAYPRLLLLDEDRVPRAPTLNELTLIEATCLALPQLLSKKTVLLTSWKSGAFFEHTLCVSTHTGELKVRLATVQGWPADPLLPSTQV